MNFHLVPSKTVALLFTVFRIFLYTLIAQSYIFSQNYKVFIFLFLKMHLLILELYPENSSLSNNFQLQILLFNSERLATVTWRDGLARKAFALQA